MTGWLSLLSGSNVKGSYVGGTACTVLTEPPPGTPPKACVLLLGPWHPVESPNVNKVFQEPPLLAQTPKGDGHTPAPMRTLPWPHLAHIGP